MRLGDRRQPPAQRGDGQAPGVIDQVQRHGVERGREALQRPGDAPGTEVAQIRLVGAQRVGRLRAARVAASSLGELGQRGDLSPSSSTTTAGRTSGSSSRASQSRVRSSSRRQRYAPGATEPTPDMGKLSGLDRAYSSVWTARPGRPTKWRRLRVTSATASRRAVAAIQRSPACSGAPRACPLLLACA